VEPEIELAIESCLGREELSTEGGIEVEVPIFEVLKAPGVGSVTFAP
jgi:hypothetical protein